MTEITEIYIEPPFIKLDQFLKFAGVCTGGQAKSMIFGGQVKVNGEECLMRGKKLFGGEIVEECDGKMYKCILKS